MDLKINDIMQGIVSNVKPFGVFIDIFEDDEKISCFCHISQVSHNFVKNIEDILSVGDQVDIKITEINQETGKLVCSIKEATPVAVQKNTKTPNLSFEDKFKDWVKQSNEKQASINRRNKRR